MFSIVVLKGRGVLILSHYIDVLYIFALWLSYMISYMWLIICDNKRCHFTWESIKYWVVSFHIIYHNLYVYCDMCHGHADSGWYSFCFSINKSPDVLWRSCCCPDVQTILTSSVTLSLHAPDLVPLLVLFLTDYTRCIGICFVNSHQ